jgi:RAP1 GTPase activating protein 1
LGEKIELDGWEGFKGGLDVKSGSTGKHAIYTEYNPGNCPILFHVSTFLPFDKNNEQQLERKRHIGNDLVVIVFQDSSEAPFRPSEVSSRMIHVLIVIRPVKFADRPDETWYRMSIISKEKTPRFAPVFENNVSIFKKGKAFRDLLFQKLLNAERATYAAPILSAKMQKTRKLLLEDAIRQLKKK